MSQYRPAAPVELLVSYLVNALIAVVFAALAWFLSLSWLIVALTVVEVGAALALWRAASGRTPGAYVARVQAWRPSSGLAPGLWPQARASLLLLALHLTVVGPLVSLLFAREGSPWYDRAAGIVTRSTKQTQAPTLAAEAGPYARERVDVGVTEWEHPQVDRPEWVGPSGLPHDQQAPAWSPPPRPGVIRQTTPPPAPVVERRVDPPAERPGVVPVHEQRPEPVVEQPAAHDKNPENAPQTGWAIPASDDSRAAWHVEPAQPAALVAQAQRVPTPVQPRQPVEPSQPRFEPQVAARTVTPLPRPVDVPRDVMPREPEPTPPSFVTPTFTLPSEPAEPSSEQTSSMWHAPAAHEQVPSAWQTGQASTPSWHAPDPAPVATIVRGGSSGSGFAVQLDTGETYPLENECVVGRNPGMGQSLGAAIAMQDPPKSISRTHLMLGLDERGVWVEDSFSATGTRVQTPHGGVKQLMPGQREHITVGTTVVLGARRYLTIIAA